MSAHAQNVLGVQSFFSLKLSLIAVKLHDWTIQPSGLLFGEHLLNLNQVCHHALEMFYMVVLHIDLKAVR